MRALHASSTHCNNLALNIIDYSTFLFFLSPILPSWLPPSFLFSFLPSFLSYTLSCWAPHSRYTAQYLFVQYSLHNIFKCSKIQRKRKWEFCIFVSKLGSLLLSPAVSFGQCEPVSQAHRFDVSCNVDWTAGNTRTLWLLGENAASSSSSFHTLGPSTCIQGLALSAKKTKGRVESHFVYEFSQCEVKVDEFSKVR